MRKTLRFKPWPASWVLLAATFGIVACDTDGQETVTPQAPAVEGDAELVVAYLASEGLVVEIVNAASGEPLWQTEFVLDGLQEPVFAPHGEDLYVGLGSDVHRIALASGDTEQIYQAPGLILGLTISEDRKMAVSVAPRDGCRPFAGECQGTDNGGIVIVDAISGGELETLVASDLPLASLDAAPFRLAWVDTDSVAIETTNFDAAGGDPVAILKLSAQEVSEVAIQSPALVGPGASLVAGRPGEDPAGCAGESRLSLLSLPSGVEVASISIDGAELSAEAWSPDGSQLLVQATIWAPPPKLGSCPQVIDEVQYHLAAVDGTTTRVDDFDHLLEEWYGTRHVRWDCADVEHSWLGPGVRQFLCFGVPGTLSLGDGTEIATANSVWVIY